MLSNSVLVIPFSRDGKLAEINEQKTTTYLTVWRQSSE